MICALCQLNRPLRRSHIIPDWVTREIQRGHPHLKIVDWDKAMAKRLPGGVYQPDFLCDDCEELTSVFEEEGARIFVNEANHWTPISNGPDVVAHAFFGANLSALKLFFVQLLLKASLSSLAAFNNIQLGPFLERFRKSVLAKDASHVQECFSVVLVRFSASKMHPGVEKSIQLPSRGHVCGCNAYWMAFNGFGAFSRVDSRPFRDNFNKMELGQSEPLIAVSKNFDSPSDLGFLVRLSQRVSNANATRGWRGR